MKTLKTARILSGYNQKEVSKLSGISDTTLSRYESGTLEIPTFRFNTLCEIYDVHPSEITLPTVKISKEEEKKRNAKKEIVTRRADALRYALSQIVPKEHMEKVIEICAMIYEVERK